MKADLIFIQFLRHWSKELTAIKKKNLNFSTMAYSLLCPSPTHSTVPDTQADI